MSQPETAEALHSSEGVRFDLDYLLFPESAGKFLERDYGRGFVYVPGTPGKFSALLPWPVLNRILEEHRLEPPRLRLTREGKPVPGERYVSYTPNRRRSGSPVPRLNSASLTSELRDGATLVLDNVDELHRPVRELAVSLERLFRVRIQVNSYAGWRTSHGFDLHWDDHDVFILQVAGRKHWKVYGVTRPFPLAGDSGPDAATPPSDVLWSGMLEDGDLLYLPRGWWHIATPLDEPTLHLTVGVNNPTGADFLGWFVQRLRETDVVRQDLPHLDGPEALSAHANLLLKAVQDGFQPALIEEYMRHLDTTSRTRPNFALPWSATPEGLPDSGEALVRWTVSRDVELDEKGGEVSFTARSRRWRFRADARPILNDLMRDVECRLDHLVRTAAQHQIAAGTLRAFVGELSRAGLVVVYPSR